MRETEQDFKVTSERYDAVHVITVAGEADLHTAPELRGAVATAIDDGARWLVIDLTEATFVDSMTLGVLLSALKRLTPSGGRLTIACPNPNLRRIFEITSLDRVLDLAPSRAEAVRQVVVGQEGLEGA